MRLIWYFLILFLTASNNKLSAQSIDSVSVNKTILTSAIVTESVLYFGSMAYLQYVWYRDHERVPFHFYNDNLGYLQIDKFGHAYGSYLESDICYHWLLRAGVKKKKAILYGATMGLVLQTPIEIFDGLYEGWGFSWGDMVANAAGPGLIISQELIFSRRVIDLKFSFFRSEYAPQAHGMLGENFLESLFYDYNGHTYWLSIGLSDITGVSAIPPWLDLSVGYSANGLLGEFENRKSWYGHPLPEVDRYRQYFISMDVDWTAVPVAHPFLKDLFKAFNYIKLPFPAIGYDRINGVSFRPVYF